MKKYGVIAIVLCFILMFTSCSRKEISIDTQTVSEQNPTEEPRAQTTEQLTVQPTEHPTNEPTAQPTEKTAPKQIITYFANWNLENKPGAEGGEVASIPWDSVTYINHAFFGIVPLDDPEETTFARRDAKKEPRTRFEIASTNMKADYEDDTPSAVDPSMPRNHFAEYAIYSEKYPNVNIMISIGGWTKCGYFSEMATTSEGRSSFISSCIALIDKYPWIDGIDIDWEYPGGSNDGERMPENDVDEGCPIWKSGFNDNQNFASLCKELREAFDTKYGIGAKKITACASASTGWTLPNQNWAPIAPYLDYINMMTYDLAGIWDMKTGHASSYQGAAGAFVYLKEKGIDIAKINIGTPYYSTVFIMDGEIDEKHIIGSPIIDKRIPGDQFTQKELEKFEVEAVSGYTTDKVDGKVVFGESFDKGGKGWHFAYDEKAKSSYMYNDDENSVFYRYYLSYENALSLQGKIDAIDKFNIAGIIIWESSEDTIDNARTKQLAENLLN
jgi:chitinase